MDLTPGEWTKETEEKCECKCPAPTVRVGYSQRTRAIPSEGEGAGGDDDFSPWSDYDFTNRIAAFNGGPGSFETQVRVQIEIQGNKRKGVVRYRQITSSQIGDPPQTQYLVGETSVITIPETEELIVIGYVFVPCTEGQSAVLVGAPARALGGLSAASQHSVCTKHGFTEYWGNSEAAVAIYRQEAVNSGGDPGCPTSGRPLKTYSGIQHFKPTTASADNGWLADPGGEYETTLSADLVAAKYASTPFGQPNVTVDFGSQSYPSKTVKNEIENFDCGGVKSKTLSLLLTDFYKTSELVRAVTDALDTQQGLGFGFTVEEGSTVHRDRLTPGETTYDKIRTTQLAAFVFGVVAGEPGSGGPDSVFADQGNAIDITVSCDVTTRFFSGSQSADRRVFKARIYALDAATGPDGRSANGDGIPIPPTLNPFESDGFANAEVVFTNIVIKPHALLSHLALFVEPTSVIDEGVDGE